MATNDFLPFAIGGGANVESQASYLADANRPLGNQPGIASSSFNNKALRQGNFIASQLAQMVSDIMSADVADNGVTAQFLGQLKGLLQTFPPVISKYTSSSGTHNLTFYFFITGGNASSGATYTNGGNTFTVVTTIAGATVLRTTGNGFPAALSGTLTKTGGSGDSTLLFWNYRAPVSVNVKAVGAGGNGGIGANGAAGTTGSDGGDTTFGTSFIVAGGGKGGPSTTNNGSAGRGGLGGTGSITGATGLTPPGSDGAVAGWKSGPGNDFPSGGNGGNSFLGGGATAGAGNSGSPGAAQANSGGGGGGTGANNATAVGGNGGGGGGGVDCTFSPAALGTSTFPYSIGAIGGTGGLAGSGVIQVVENFQ